MDIAGFVAEELVAAAGTREAREAGIGRVAASRRLPAAGTVIGVVRTEIVAGRPPLASAGGLSAGSSHGP